jgi:hypothetical protein
LVSLGSDLSGAWFPKKLTLSNLANIHDDAMEVILAANQGRSLEKQGLDADLANKLAGADPPFMFPMAFSVLGRHWLARFGSTILPLQCFLSLHILSVCSNSLPISHCSTRGVLAGLDHNTFQS